MSPHLGLYDQILLVVFGCLYKYREEKPHVCGLRMHSCNNASYRPKKTFRRKNEKSTIMSKIDEKTKNVITEALTKIETRLAPQGLHVLVGVGEWAQINSFKYDRLVLGVIN